MKRPLALLALVAATAGCGPEGERAELPLRDDFSSPCAWAETETAAASLDCVGGIYRVVAKRGGRPVAAHRAIESSPALRLRATMEFEEGPAYLSGNERAGFGLGCWTRPAGDGYVFLVSPAGYAVIGRVKRNQPGFETLAETDEALERPAVPGDEVEVRADCLAPGGREARLVLGIDGRTVLATDDPDRASPFRDIGFYIATTADNAGVSFDELAADELTGSSLRSALAQEEPVVEPGTPRVLLRDDFGDPATGWPEGRARAGTFGYADGSYRIRLDLDGSIRRGLLVADTAARAVEVHVSGIERDGEPVAAGIGCYASAERGYLFVAEADGGYSIEREGADATLSVVARARPGADAGARARELTATCSGSRSGATRLELAVDGETVVSAVDEGGVASFRGAALLARSATGDSEVRFDELLVRRL